MKATCDPEKSVSVIIPVFNSQETIAACLQAVFRSSLTPFDVIVVDDGSTDDSAAIARRFPCRVIQLEKQSGPGTARNAGARLASSNIMFFLDSDILIEPDTLSLISDCLRDRPELSGLFCSYQKDTIPSNFCSTYKNLLHHFIHQTSREEASTFCGGFGALTKNAFLSVGGFDESYTALEDVELGYRLMLAGHKIFLNKRIQVTHCKTYSLLGLIKSDVLNRAIPWTRIMVSKSVFKNDLNTRIHHVISVPVAFLILILLPLSFQFPMGLLILALLTASLLALNHSFLIFVFREKGPAFTLQTVIMNWVGYLYSGAGLVFGLLPYARGRFVEEKM
ncbi:MAG: glycosyltransferase [bacterium]